MRISIFKVPKPQYDGETELFKKECDIENPESVGKITLRDWFRGSPNPSNARVFIQNGTSPNILITRINEEEVNAYMRDEHIKEFAFLCSEEDRYINKQLEKHGLDSYRICKYIRMFANVNGFLAAGQIAISQADNPDKQSPIRTDNPRFTFFVKDKSTVECIEECDVILNPSYEIGKGDIIAHLRVVSIISINNQKICHSLHSTSLTPCPGKKRQCLEHFGDDRFILPLIVKLYSKLVSILKKMFSQCVDCFTSNNQYEQLNDCAESPSTSLRL